MEKIEIKETDDSLMIIFNQDRSNNIVIGVLSILLLLSLLFIPSLIFLSGISAGVLIAILLTLLISFYFLKLLLWNVKGREILELSPNELIHTIDYAGIYKEAENFDNKNLQIGKIDSNQDISKDLNPDILDNNISTLTRSEEIVISQDKEIVIHIHTKVSLKEREMIESSLMKYLNP